MHGCAVIVCMFNESYRRLYKIRKYHSQNNKTIKISVPTTQVKNRTYNILKDLLSVPFQFYFLFFPYHPQITIILISVPDLSLEFCHLHMYPWIMHCFVLKS